MSAGERWPHSWLELVPVLAALAAMLAGCASVSAITVPGWIILRNPPQDCQRVQCP